MNSEQDPKRPYLAIILMPYYMVTECYPIFKALGASELFCHMYLVVIMISTVRFVWAFPTKKPSDYGKFLYYANNAMSFSLGPARRVSSVAARRIRGWLIPQVVEVELIGDAMERWEQMQQQGESLAKMSLYAARITVQAIWLSIRTHLS